MCVQGGAARCSGVFVQALKYWQKLTTGFADFNAKKHNIEAPAEHIQRALVKLLDGSDDDEAADAALEYMRALFAFYNESKQGALFHAMYADFRDIDFRKIHKNAPKVMLKELQTLLFNEEVTRVDADKIRNIFGKCYVDTLGQEQKL